MPTPELSVPTGARPETLHAYLLDAAGVTPERPAVVEFAGNEDVRVTSYRQLAQQVHRYAAELAEPGLDIGDRVVLESDTSAHAIAALLACSSLGLPFIPVSPETPDERLRAILAAAKPALYLRADGLTRETLTERPADGGFGPDGLWIRNRPEPRERHRRELAGTDTAYIIFTSGTTGRPKGVVMSHRAVLAFYRGMLQHGIVTGQDRVATTSPLQFDFSLLDIGLALGSGAAVVPVPRPLLRWPHRFLQVLKDTGATQVNGVPSIWRQALQYLPDRLAGLESVRGVLFCGEEFPLPELRRLQRLLPHARLVNCYGATESMACSFTDVPRPLPEDTERLSIGFAHQGAEMTLADEHGRPVAEPGVTGEIYLRSPALFTGYWDDPVATQAALVPDPLSPESGQVAFRTGDLACHGPRGELYFCGRVDSQVQIRGNRVELAEVERRLSEFPGVTAATALVLRPPTGEPELAAVVVFGKDTRAADEAELLSFCRQTLPGYMVPQVTFVADELPVTANGKVDRAALTHRMTERRTCRDDDRAD